MRQDKDFGVFSCSQQRELDILLVAPRAAEREKDNCQLCGSPRWRCCRGSYLQEGGFVVVEIRQLMASSTGMFGQVCLRAKFHSVWSLFFDYSSLKWSMVV